MAKNEIVLTYDEYVQFTEERQYAQQAKAFGWVKKETPLLDRVKESLNPFSPDIQIIADREAETMTLRDMA